MNDSNQSLRFSRSYLEATGKPLHSRDFYDPDKHATLKDAIIGIVGFIVLCTVIYILKVA